MKNRAAFLTTAGATAVLAPLLITRAKAALATPTLQTTSILSGNKLILYGSINNWATAEVIATMLNRGNEVVTQGICGFAGLGNAYSSYQVPTKIPGTNYLIEFYGETTLVYNGTKVSAQISSLTKNGGPTGYWEPGYEAVTIGYSAQINAFFYEWVDATGYIHTRWALPAQGHVMAANPNVGTVHLVGPGLNERVRRTGNELSFTTRSALPLPRNYDLLQNLISRTRPIPMNTSCGHANLMLFLGGLGVSYTAVTFAALAVIGVSPLILIVGALFFGLALYQFGDAFIAQTDACYPPSGLAIRTPVPAGGRSIPWGTVNEPFVPPVLPGAVSAGGWGTSVTGYPCWYPCG